jgi:predicted nuclease of predicted toxin-antitoxin system
MKFLIDESVEKPIVDWLRNQKYDVIYIAEKSPAITDEKVIRFANSESRILITNDKDFSELIFRQGKITQGILLIRAANEESSNKIRLVKEVLKKAKNKLRGNFVVVNETGIRIRKIYQKN